jgi:outer membrane protein assembly factor BamB
MTMKRLQTYLVFAAVTALPAAAHADDWAAPGLDAAHLRLSTERSGASFGDGHWSFSPAGDVGVLASPVVAEGYVVSARVDGTVNALSAESGQLVWQKALGASVQGTPVIASGRVYVPTLGNRLVALGLAGGQPLWSADLGGMVVSSPAIVNGDLIVGSGLPQQTVVRLDGQTGALVWRSPAVMEQFSNTPPAVGSGLVVVGSNGGHYFAFDVATGALRWDYRADGVVNVAAPLIANGRVYMAGGSESDHVHAVDLATGAAVAGWPITLPSPDPDIAGTRKYRRRSVSSFVAAGGAIVLETRLDDALDTDADGIVDQVLARESAVALDPASGAVLWQQPTARVVFSEPNSVPGFVVCPTPAAFTTDSGAALLAVSSSLVGRVSILETQAGAGQGDVATAGRALASPVMANGRLITVAENGTVEGWLSGVNHPPSTPVAAANPQPLDATDVTLRWAAAMDPDGEQPNYELRLDTDGEVLQSYAQSLIPQAGATSMAIPGPLTAGVTYTFSLRARDSHGAYSAWSAPETFTVVAPPAVTVNGMPAANLRAAIESALAGDLIALGAGTYPLSSTLHPAGGVRITGAGAGRTILDGRGLAVGISFGKTDPKSPTGMDHATVTGAATCVSVEGTAAGVELTHLIAHDCATAGIAVAAGGAAAVVNATLTASGVGMDVAGSATIKNSIVSANQTGLRASGAGTLASSYDDLFGNQTDRQGVTAGTGDLSAPVVFANAASHDYRLVGPQPSTDQGDPADAVGDEPTPNGQRINLGAFGGTADAELSTLAPVTSDPPPSPVPTTGGVTHPLDEPGGCGVAGHRPRGSALALAFLAAAMLLTVRRRRT